MISHTLDSDHEVKYRTIIGVAEDNYCREFPYIEDIYDVCWVETGRPVKQSKIVNKVLEYATENSSDILSNEKEGAYWAGVYSRIDEGRGK